MIDHMTNKQRIKSIHKLYPAMPPMSWIAIAGVMVTLGLLGLFNREMEDRYGDDSAILYQAIKAKADIARDSKRNGA